MEIIDDNYQYHVEISSKRNYLKNLYTKVSVVEHIVVIDGFFKRQIPKIWRIYLLRLFGCGIFLRMYLRKNFKHVDA